MAPLFDFFIIKIIVKMAIVRTIVWSNHLYLLRGYPGMCRLPYWTAMWHLRMSCVMRDVKNISHE